ncbi:MAG: class I SAM-dependent methyltransferase [Planctomycetes bacterium]|nr:class I SAM-dependent methyltransferase [Planctomycetota bacterium]
MQEISEYEIKPRAALNEWQGLVEKEISSQWKDHSKWIGAGWPTCAEKDVRTAFDRFGVSYVESPSCGSLFAKTRPNEDALWSWYRDSAPSHYWREKILPASDSSRREKIVRPRADWILDGIAEYKPATKTIIDLSPYGRQLLDVLAEENHSLKQITAAGTTADLEGKSTTQIRVKPSKLADLLALGPADVVVAVDALNRAADVSGFLEAIGQSTAPGGLAFLTATVASGFEIQSLWEKSPSVMPPDKLNLPSVAALQKFFAAPGWEILELSTPGMFDVEMVFRAMLADPAASWPRVLRGLVQHSDPQGRSSLVELLQAQRLISFARLVARRTGEC